MVFLQSSETECAGESLRTRIRIRRTFILSPLRVSAFLHSLDPSPTSAVQHCCAAPTDLIRPEGEVTVHLGYGTYERRCRSFRLNVRRPDYFAPLLSFTGNELAELSGRHRHRHSA